MVDLRVDHTMLDNLQQSSGEVAEGSSTSGPTPRSPAAPEAEACCEVSMAEFVGNWVIHREKVTSALRDLADDCKGVAETFHAVEQGLSRAAADTPGRRQAP